MARELKHDKTHNLWFRTVGLDRKGRKPKFWLGDKEAEAQRRVERLELLWSQVKQDWKTLADPHSDWLETTWLPKTDKPTWDDLTLKAAKAIAKGEISIPVPRKPSWSPLAYTKRLMDLQRRFNAVNWTPEEKEAEFHKIGADLVKMDANSDIDQAQQQLALVAGQIAGQTLHQAFDAYIEYLKKLPDPTGWYLTQIKQTTRLKENHPDLTLAQVGQAKIEEMIDYWRHRPTIKEKRIAATTARNEIIQLDMILKWIDRRDEFPWELPRRFADIKRKVKEDENIIPQVEVFSVADLTTLWLNASPLVRLQMLLALNCGFKYAEIGSLLFDHIHLNTAYPGVVQVNRPEGMGDWITRFRPKTKVYGEWKLWPITAAGIAWAMQNRQHPAKGGDDTLLISRAGLRLNAQTSTGKKSNKMYSSWKYLYKVVPQGTKYLPFKHLEKTATDWLRSNFGGEVANLFVCHGKPVPQDKLVEVYSNKPFSRLFSGLDALFVHLKPMFEIVADPFPR